MKEGQPRRIPRSQYRARSIIDWYCVGSPSIKPYPSSNNRGSGTWALEDDFHVQRGSAQLGRFLVGCSDALGACAACHAPGGSPAQVFGPWRISLSRKDRRHCGLPNSMSAVGTADCADHPHAKMGKQEAKLRIDATRKELVAILIFN